MIRETEGLIICNERKHAETRFKSKGKLYDKACIDIIGCGHRRAITTKLTGKPKRSLAFGARCTKTTVYSTSMIRGS